MNRFNISFHNENINLPQYKVMHILQEIGNLNGKKCAQIQSHYANRFSGLSEKIWFIATRNFPDTNKCFSGTDPEQSRSIFDQIAQQLPDNPYMRNLFNRAIASFNQMIDPGQPINGVTEVELSPFEADLASWAADPSATGIKSEAAARILDAYYNEKTKLGFKLLGAQQASFLHRGTH